MLTSPCKNCGDRKLNCWSTCEPYLKYKAERVAINTARAKEHKEFWEWNSVFYRPKEKRK